MERHTHEDGRVCEKREYPGEDPEVRWYYRTGSAALESVGVDTKPYIERCDREHVA